MEFNLAPDVQNRIRFLVKSLPLNYIQSTQLVCFRSIGSSSRARARIWSLPSIWQKALRVKAHYCIEVISEKYDHLSPDDQERVLIHELLHIPKNFSGALVPHRTAQHRTFRHYHDTVETLFNSLNVKSYE